MSMNEALNRKGLYDGINELARRSCRPRIVVVGCGGGGNNSLNRLTRIGIEGAETLAVNTDQMHLQSIDCDKKILIGKTKSMGLGAGGDPRVGEMCTEQAEADIRELLDRPNITLITAGMGGGTGTGSAPVIARIAKELGSIVVGIVTTPFEVERARNRNARIGLEKLRRHADSVIILDNNRLLDMVPNLPLDQAFSVMDQLISEVIKGITETITVPSLINLDFADFKTIMSRGGTATVLYGECNDQEPERAVIDALNNPLLDIDYSGATGAMVHITGGTNLSLSTVDKVTRGITNQLDPEANVIFGARIDSKYNGRIKVISIMTGVHSPQLMGRVTDPLDVEVGGRSGPLMELDIPIIR